MHAQVSEPAEPPEAEAGGKRKPSGSVLSIPVKKRKVGKLPKGASELLNKWQAVQKDLVSLAPLSPSAMAMPLKADSLTWCMHPGSAWLAFAHVNAAH